MNKEAIKNHLKYLKEDKFDREFYVALVLYDILGLSINELDDGVVYMAYKFIDECDSIYNLDMREKLRDKYDKYNNQRNELEDIISKLKLPIKNWYLENYPDDDVGETLSSSVTFLDLNNLINSGKEVDIYSFLGGYSDTIIRERCFEKLAELIDCPYDEIYEKWLGINEKDKEFDLV